MPRKASIVCQSCNWSADGSVPDYKMPGYNHLVEGFLKVAIQKHHEDTRRTTGADAGFYGHRYYDVFLEDGRNGTIEGNSYQVWFKESAHPRGIERE